VPLRLVGSEMCIRDRSQCFEGMYHEIFNDLYRAQVFNALKRWLLARFSA
jgi:alpha-beta hydrolase superfamily lysophospholipase